MGPKDPLWFQNKPHNVQLFIPSIKIYITYYTIFTINTLPRSKIFYQDFLLSIEKMSLEHFSLVRHTSSRNMPLDLTFGFTELPLNISNFYYLKPYNLPIRKCYNFKYGI